MDGVESIVEELSAAHRGSFKREHWEGSFEEYLELVKADPKITRNAFQRVYDMILSYGVENFERNREKLTRYKFFSDSVHRGADAVFGLEKPLSELVNAFRSAAFGYGVEKRVLLLHGPVGSSKSTIARLLKRGLEEYSRTDAGALYTFGWIEDGDPASYTPCPMHEEPLKLVPKELRPKIFAMLSNETHTVDVKGELDPFCRRMFNDRLRQYDGDWKRLLRDV
ncbi:MAG: PrkA family serine protein kinase, partial [Planctomycetia bacterium]